MSQPAGQQQIPVGWIVGLAAACLMAGLYCCRSEYESQFNTAVIYGYSMINTILFSQLFFPEEMPIKSMYLVSCGGAVLYIITGILLIVETDSLSESIDLRIFITSILCLGNGAIFMFEFIALLTRPEMLD